jgi:hypothetical protein
MVFAALFSLEQKVSQRERKRSEQEEDVGPAIILENLY